MLTLPDKSWLADNAVSGRKLALAIKIEKQTKINRDRKHISNNKIFMIKFPVPDALN